MAAAKALEEQYQSFEALFNEMYEAKFRSGPQLPRFSLLRSFTAQWALKVFTPLESSLLASTLNLLDSLRSERLLKSQIRLDDLRILTLMKYPPIQDHPSLPRPQHHSKERLLP